MASPQEVEIKFRVDDLKALARKLRAAGFRIKTKRTHELNTLYDFPDFPLRQRGEVLRIRKYGDTWTVTHKSKGSAGRHKSRTETETQVSDGQKLESIFNPLGLAPAFRYEKFRTEWTDGKADVVVDETPIGNFAEIEGPAHWIDSTARKLGISPDAYNTKSYVQLFLEWKLATGSDAQNMTWKALNKRVPRKP